MIKAIVKNFRGAKSAEIDLSKMSIIYGDNGMGKSSTAQGLQAILSGNPITIKGLNKNSAMLLVNDKARSAEVRLETDKGSRVMTWPECECVEIGEPSVNASKTALGYSPILDDDKKSKALFFSEFLKALPSKKDLKDEIGELAKDKFDNIWKTVEANGWDKAADIYAEKMTQQKGVFKAVAKTNWGSSKGESFTPEHWSPDLEHKSKAQLEAFKQQAHDAVEACVANEALSQDKIDEMRKKIDSVPSLIVELNKIKKKEDRAVLSRVELGNRPQEIKASDPGTPCPSCGTHLVFNKNKLTIAGVDEYTKEEVEERNNEIKIFDEKMKNLVEIERQNASERTLNLSKTEDAENAEAELAKVLEAENVKTYGESELNTARETLRIAIADLDSFEQKDKANRAHKAVIFYETISKVLKPDGLRQKKLSESLRNFNNRIKSYFPEYPVEVGSDLCGKWDGRHLYLCCESEIWRADVAIRAAMSHELKDSIIIIDRADILSNKNKNILFKRLSRLLPKPLIFTTVKNKSEATPLPKDRGNSYFIENGILEDL